MPRTRRRSPGSGGARQGAQGASYTNRQDLNEAPRQAVQTASGQPYGARTAQEQAQKAMPLPAQAPIQPAGTAVAPPAYMTPDDVPTFGAPSQRPDEPVTAGLSFGPGRTPSPNASMMRQADPVNDDLVDQLRALYFAYPSRELRELIEEADL
jgi:hypothetical protein